jgi:glycosyltransferase involved in cell wall biosynthesis
MPRVSFAVTCCNHESYIGEALESIFRQTLTNDFEVILVDDASTDSSDVAIRSFHDPRIRYTRHTERQGETYTVNEVLTLAQGTYVARLDGDDRLRPDFLERTLPILERYPEVGLVYGDCARINAQGDLVEDPFRGLPSREVHGGRVFKGDEYLSLVLENVVSATSLIRREALELALPIPSDFNNSDWYVNLRIARRYELYYVAATLFDYRIHGKNRHLHFESERAFAHTVIRILDQVFGEPDRQAEKSKIRRRAYGAAYLKFANSCFGAGHMKDARGYYTSALLYQPRYLLDGAFVRHWLGTFLGFERYNKLKARVFKSGPQTARIE